jgi:hypothetical protein
MRPLAAAALLVLQTVAASPAATAPQTDAVAALILELQDALQTGTTAAFVARRAPDLPVEQAAELAALVDSRTSAVVAVRERARAPDSVLTEVFVAQGASAFIANWRLGLDPDAAPGARLVSLTALSTFHDLLRVQLDESRQFAVTGLVITGPDFTVTLPAGTVFLADVSDGTTALVLQGRADVRFAPASRTEQGQLEIFAGAPAFTTVSDDIFVRVNPRELPRVVSWTTLTPVELRPSDLNRARNIFAQRARLSFHVDLGDLSGEPWSVEPAAGSMLVDFRTRRFGWLTYSHAPDDPEDIALFDRERHRQISLYASGGRPADREALLEDGDASYAVRHTTLDLSFDPDRLWMNGTASVRIVLRKAAASFTMRLARTLVVSSISSPELGPLLPLRASGYDSIIIGLPESVPEGTVINVDVQYHGRLEPQRLAHEVVAPGAQLPDRTETEAVPLYIEPRYLFSNRSWWYPQSSASDHAPARIRLTVPAEYRSVATGRMVSDELSFAVDREGNPTTRQLRTTEFIADRPVRYLACLVTRLLPAGRVRVPVPSVSGDTDPDGRGAALDVDVLTGPRQVAASRTTAERVASIVRFYADLMGDAPYPSLSVVSLEDLLPGGHSPAYFALLNQPHPFTPLSWSGDPVAFPDVPEFFLAHEVAHQWWGQAVGWRNYHEQWISEGFAQYFAWLHLSSAAAPETAHGVMSRMRRTASGLADEGPIHLGYRLGHLRGDSRIFRSVVYNKSAVVLHMLHRFVGDDAFKRAVRRIYQTWRFRRAGIDDIRLAFQAETPLPLDRFFTRWILESGTPSIRMSWSQRDGGTTVVRAEQVGELFDLPYDVTVIYADDTRERVTLRLTRASEDFPVGTRGPVRRVEFDDELTLVRVMR